MQEILKTTLLEFEKSTFLLDIVKYHSGKKYISIQQIITSEDHKQILNINSSVLPDIISVLQMYQNEIGNPKIKKSRNYFSEEKQQRIVKLYLKGNTLDALAMLFNSSKKLIEQILVNKNIEIVDQKRFKPHKGFQFRRRKK